MLPNSRVPHYPNLYLGIFFLRVPPISKFTEFLRRTLGSKREPFYGWKHFQLTWIQTISCWQSIQSSKSFFETEIRHQFSSFSRLSVLVQKASLFREFILIAQINHFFSLDWSEIPGRRFLSLVNYSNVTVYLGNCLRDSWENCPCLCFGAWVPEMELILHKRCSDHLNNHLRLILSP